MNVEEEVLKIQKKLGKMTSSDGTVSNGGIFIIFRLISCWQKSAHHFWFWYSNGWLVE